MSGTPVDVVMTAMDTIAREVEKTMNELTGTLMGLSREEAISLFYEQLAALVEQGEQSFIIR